MVASSGATGCPSGWPVRCAAGSGVLVALASGLRHRRRGDLVRLQGGQHIAAETANLLEELLLWHRAAVQADQHRIGARVLGGIDDAVAHLVCGAPRLRL